MFGDEWYEDLPSPDILEWEDVKEQIEEEPIDSSEAEGEDGEPTGVVLTHLPSSVSAAADEYRTREENRELARDRLLDKIIQRIEEIEDEQAYPESEQMEGFEDDRGGPEDRWTPPEPDDPPWNEESDQTDLP